MLIYEALGRLAPSPMVNLNRAVAVSMAQGPAAALPIVDEPASAEALSNSHLLPSVRGELLTRLSQDQSFWVAAATGLTARRQVPSV